MDSSAKPAGESSTSVVVLNLNPEIDLLGVGEVGLPEEESVEESSLSSEDLNDVIDTGTINKTPYQHFETANIARDAELNGKSKSIRLFCLS